MDDSISDKVNYVKSQEQYRNHTCHWPGCEQQVPPALWGCKKHWYMLPEYLRMRVWAAYRIGQEVNMNPSDEYMAVIKMVNEWIKDHPEGK